MQKNLPAVESHQHRWTPTRSFPLDTNEEEEEELAQEEYDDKCNELVELQQELRAMQLEVDQLKIRRKAAAVDTVAAMPICEQTPEQQQCLQNATDVRCLIEWLAKNVDTTVPAESLQVSAMVPFAGRQLRIDTVAQWRCRKLPRIHFSVELPHQEELIGAVMEAREPGGLSHPRLERLVSSWELLRGHISPLPSHPAQPVVFLVHRETGLSGIIAEWPSKELLQATHDLIFQPGERVQFRCGADWLPGLLMGVNELVASVRLDQDAEHIVTHVPIQSVRKLKHIPMFEASAGMDGGKCGQQAELTSESNDAHHHTVVVHGEARPAKWEHRRTKSAM